MHSQHHRFRIWNQLQHPYSHAPDEIGYSNPSLPESEVTNLQQTLDWLLAVLYPQVQDAVDTPGDLPAAGNTLGDYRVVTDDGDGKAAAYRWQQLEGDVAPQWYKIYDMDWGEQSVLSNFLLKTQDVYVYRYGIDDLDENGAAYAGDLAGQRVYGGATAGTHLTLYANAGDGVGPGTGFIQFGDNSRPLVDSSFSLGTDTYRFLNFYTDEANVSTMQIQGGSITDSSGAIDFGDENLGTNGTIGSGTLLLAGGSITDASGTIDFNDENLQTTGTGTFDSVTATGGISAFSALTTIGNLTFGLGSITSASGAISFGDENLSTTGSLTAGSVLVDLMTINASDISTSAGDLSVSPAGAFNINASTFVTGNLDVGGNIIVGAANNMTLDESGIITDQSFTISNTAGNIGLQPFNEQLTITANTFPSADDTYDLGLTGNRWQDLWMSDTGSIRDGTLSIAVATIMSFRDALAGAASGMSLFYDGSKWNASLPDTEIDHGTISGLGDDDHTQYLLLAGRSTGQSVFGGVAAGENLILDSTSHATKGEVRFASDLAPTSDLGVDVGTSGLRFNNLYMGGQGVGFRVENVTSGTLPAAGSTGRAVWTTDTDALYIDTGTALKKLVSDKFVEQQTNTIWDGAQTTNTTDVSSQFDDAREAVWDFKDNTNGFRSVDGAVITHPSATQVTVTFTIAPASGTYTLVGVG